MARLAGSERLVSHALRGLPTLVARLRPSQARFPVHRQLRGRSFSLHCKRSHKAGPLLIVTDSMYVHRGFLALANLATAPFASHQDLWAAAAALGGGQEVTTRWVPAHRIGPDPPLLSLADWEGNALADAFASKALEAAQPPPVLLAAALAAQTDYSAAVTIGAAVLEAQLHWAHQGIATGPTRFPARPSGLAVAVGPIGPPREDMDSLPSGVHCLAVSEPTPGVFVLACSACGRTSLLRKQWCHLIYSRCTPPAPALLPAPLISWEREYHHMVRQGLSVVACARCGLRTAAGRLAQWKRRMCVARRLLVNGLATAEDWGAIFAQRLGWAPGPPPAAPTVISLLVAGASAVASASARAVVPPQVIVPLSMRFGHAARARKAIVAVRPPGQAVLSFGQPSGGLPGSGLAFSPLLSVDLAAVAPAAVPAAVAPPLVSLVPAGPPASARPAPPAKAAVSAPARKVVAAKRPPGQAVLSFAMPLRGHPGSGLASASPSGPLVPLFLPWLRSPQLPRP